MWIETCESVAKKPEVRDILKALLFQLKEDNFCDERHIKVLMEGNPSIGTIHHFSQMHNFLSIDGKQDCSTTEVQQYIISVQYKILQDIMNWWYDALFLEGHSDIDESLKFGMNLSSIVFNKKFASIHNYPSPEFRKAVFEFLQVDNVWAARARLLYLFWWAVVAAGFLQTTTEVQGAEDSLTHKKTADSIWFSETCEGMLEKMKNNHLDAQKDKIDKLHNYRELVLMKKVQEYMQKNPWKKIAVIYGWLHNFHQAYIDVFGIKIWPRFERVTYPKDITSSMWLENYVRPEGVPATWSNTIVFIEN